MSSIGPPKFKPFTKTKVVLSLEPTPKAIDVKTDLTVISATPFRDAIGQGPDSEIQGPAADEVVAVTEPSMFGKKGKKAKKVPDSSVPGTPGALSAFPGLLKKKVAEKAPGPPRVYSRLDMVSRDFQAAEIGKLPEALQALAKSKHRILIQFLQVSLHPFHVVVSAPF